MNKFFVKKVFITSLAIVFMGQALYLWAIEPTILDAATAPDDVIVTLNVTSGLTLSDGANVTMAPNIGTIYNGSIGGSYWVATTNSATGYTLAVKASTSPALKNGSVSSFADYTESTTGVPETWSADASSYQFGYSVNGLDVSSDAWGTATDCGTSGAPNANGKYRGLTTSDVTVASRGTVTPTGGVQTNICFAAEQKNVYAPSGTYTATITATMTAS